MLGVSRKTYYEWEKRTLAGMLSQLDDLPAGRPPKVQDPEKQLLERRILRLEQDLYVAQQTAEIMAAMEERKEQPSKKNATD